MVTASELPPGALAAEAGWFAVRTACRMVSEGPRRATPRRPAAPEGWRHFVLGRPGGARPKPTPSARELEDCLHEADDALEGRFSVLGYGTVHPGTDERRWHRDPVHGFTWAARDHRELGPAPGTADIKIPWEVSRLQWLVALARAHAYTSDPRYRDGARRLLRSWAVANPPGWGPNWVNAMEAGIRAVNLVWAAEILDDPRFTAAVGGMLRDHGRYIVGNLEYSPRITINHYLADIVGLVYVGGALRHRCVGRLWLGFASRQLQHEILKQFHQDGSNFEASLGYHRLSTELVTMGLLALRRLDVRVRPDAVARFESAVQALTALTGPHGMLPAVGDDDSGLVVGLQSGRNPRDPDSVVSAASAVLTSRSAGGTTTSELAQWCGARPSGPGRPNAARPSVAFPDGGWYVLSSRRYWCLVDCGRVGQRGNGGHGHNDTLSFVLCADGREIITDPGTGVYTADPRLRNELRATRSHSTVEVDGCEQNRFDPKALLTLHDDDHARVICYHADDSGRQLLDAVHEGYRRLADPVLHRRRFTLDDQGLTVSDELECRGPHTVVVTFPLAAGVKAETDGGCTRLFAAGTTVSLTQLAGPSLFFQIQQMVCSPAYGRVVDTGVLRATLRIDGPASWDLRFRLAAGGQG
ncbi:heparinase II/III family protein [Streptomyces sp. NPDC001796]|uniref:heparinase II/III domain-containing protein n=1 Tax=Streptomyces sp. NPDC001796 TaxID=3364609 RepID=UPI00367C41F6